jgi:hypothetical protein
VNKYFTEKRNQREYNIETHEPLAFLMNPFRKTVLMNFKET